MDELGGCRGVALSLLVALAFIWFPLLIWVLI